MFVIVVVRSACDVEHAEVGLLALQLSGGILPGFLRSATFHARRHDRVVESGAPFESVRKNGSGLFRPRDPNGDLCRATGFPCHGAGEGPAFDRYGGFDNGISGFRKAPVPERRERQFVPQARPRAAAKLLTGDEAGLAPPMSASCRSLNGPVGLKCTELSNETTAIGTMKSLLGSGLIRQFSQANEIALRNVPKC
jgi:hypothetical protein